MIGVSSARCLVKKPEGSVYLTNNPPGNFTGTICAFRAGGLLLFVLLPNFGAVDRFYHCAKASLHPEIALVKVEKFTRYSLATQHPTPFVFPREL